MDEFYCLSNFNQNNQSMKQFKKIVLAIAIFSAFVNTQINRVLAQIPAAKGSWQWVNGIGSADNTTVYNDERINILKTDKWGNTYVCGDIFDYPFIKTAGQHANRTMVSDRLQVTAQLHGFVAKYDCNGTLQWFKQIGDTVYTSRMNDMILDTAGNVYLYSVCTPYFLPTYFDTVLLTPYAPPSGQLIHPTCAFLKLNPQGKLIWKWLPPMKWGATTSITVRPLNGVYNHSTMFALSGDTLTLIGTLDTTNTGGGGVYFLDFNINTGNLMLTTFIKHSNFLGDPVDFAKDVNGNYLLATNTSSNIDSIVAMDTVIHIPHTYGRGVVFNFSRTHMIQAMFSTDTLSIVQADLRDVKHGFKLTFSGADYGKRIIGNFVSHFQILRNSPYYGGSGLPTIKFDKINHPIWLLDADSSFQGGDFYTPFNNGLGKDFSVYNVTFKSYYHGHLYTSPNGFVTDHFIAVLNSDSGVVTRISSKIMSTQPIQNNSFSLQGGIANEKGEAILYGNYTNNIILAGQDSAIFQGGDNDVFFIKYGYPCSTDSALIEPVATDGLVANCAGDSIKLMWNDNSNIEWGYKIYRSLSASSSYALIATTPPNATIYFDKNVTTNTNYWYKVAAYNNIDTGRISNSDSSSLWCKTVGINDLKMLNQKLKIYPNPTSSNINIQLSEGSFKTIEITDVIGQIMTMMTIHQSATTIQVADFRSGVYFIKAIDMDGNVFNTKFVKE